MWYGVATISRLLKIIGLFCKRALSKRLYSAKATCNFKDPTHCSHSIASFDHLLQWLSRVISTKQRKKERKNASLAAHSVSVVKGRLFRHRDGGTSGKTLNLNTGRIWKPARQQKLQPHRRCVGALTRTVDCSRQRWHCNTLQHAATPLTRTVDWPLTRTVDCSKQRWGSREKGRDGHCNLKRISVIAKRRKENDFHSRERVLRTCHASHGPIPFGISEVTWRPWHKWVCVGLISDGNRITNPFLILVKVDMCYGVATIRRLLKIIGLFCRTSSLL